MKNIHDPEFSRIKTLLQSSIKEDVILGLEYVVKEFNEDELLLSFPNMHSIGNFTSKCIYTMWIRKGDVIVGTGDAIYAFFDEDKQWTNPFKNNEIK